MSTKQIAANALREGMRSVQQTLSETRRSIATLREQRKALRMMMDTVLFFLTQMNHSSLSVWVSAYGRKPVVTFYVNGIDGFKDPHLAKAIEFLTVLCPDVETRDYAEAVNRDFHFKGESFNASIAAYVKSDSDTCKRIEVSRKTVQRDEVEYKIVCD